MLLIGLMNEPNLLVLDGVPHTGMLLTVLMRESSTLTAKAVPQANGCVIYSGVSGSSSSSWSKNCTLESLAEKKKLLQFLLK